ncbi:ABC transporter substrate-binding protein [Mycolicibacterium rhodesiae]|uniref:Putative aliphatic sulfonates-binding protein n=1 Tax=Mycolicibacterium rhodesiae TaxID=36814 RepID=A0A1X0IT59_MYCRH|nr:ABC transporter substrate-binding protein [Mycolicibacterium rhodesiae]MCV7343989.1 ABC transporter substrate-binding protein [Mycolicibacterium rhodesiae]ORB51875.1 ABC transporter substrate-binding protein [Mycolicibacterium rhodesiae]
MGLLLTGCVSRQQSTGASQAPATVPLSELSGLTLQVGDQKGGTEALLRAAGALDNLPYQVVFSTFTSGPPQIEAATAGKIDFAITGNTPPIFGAASNAKVKVVSVYNGGGVGDQILVQADSPIQSVSDLRGKSIAVGKGSSAHGHLLGQLDKAGLTPADVKLVFLQPADALSAFKAGQADAWAIWDPYTAQAEQQLKVRSIAQAKGVTNGYWFGVASDAALADPKRSSALADLLVRFAKAAKWAQDHPQEWAEKYSAAVGLDPKAAEVSQSRSLRLPTVLSDEVVASEQKIADLFAKSGQIQTAPDFSKWVDRRYAAVLEPVLISSN